LLEAWDEIASLAGFFHHLFSEAEVKALANDQNKTMKRSVILLKDLRGDLNASQKYALKEVRAVV
jgi:hypothetical protein